MVIDCENTLRINAESLSKSYLNKILFMGIRLDLVPSVSLCIKGPNGSGKSTLIKILAKMLKPTEGKISYYEGNQKIEDENVVTRIGFLGPYIEPYGELTVYENIHFILRTPVSKDGTDRYLHDFGIYNHRNVQVSHLSTGLKQRLKFLISIINDPPALFFDEPGTNLDKTGKDLIYRYIVENKKNRIVVIATNATEEEKLCSEVLSLGK